MLVSCSHRRNQMILVIREREIGCVIHLGRPLVRKDYDGVGSLCDLCCPRYMVTSDIFDRRSACFGFDGL